MYYPIKSSTNGIFSIRFNISARLLLEKRPGVATLT